jgi:hypothetical protein
MGDSYGQTRREGKPDQSVARTTSQANEGQGESGGQGAAIQVGETWAIVPLTWDEVKHAGTVALERVLYNLKHKIKEKHGAKTVLGGLDFHFAGCLGEKSLSKYTGIPWDGNLGNFKAKDVGKLQVRAGTGYRYRLRMHPEDDDNDIFVLAHTVTASLPRVRLGGWLRGYEGKKKEFWSAPIGRWAFWIEMERCHPMSTLLAEMDL